MRRCAFSSPAVPLYGHFHPMGPLCAGARLRRTRGRLRDRGRFLRARRAVRFSRFPCGAEDAGAGRGDATRDRRDDEGAAGRSSEDVLPARVRRGVRLRPRCSPTCASCWAFVPSRAPDPRPPARLAGPIAAAAAGIPYVNHNFGHILPDDIAALAAEEGGAAVEAGRPRAAPARGALQHLYLDALPPELAVPRHRRRGPGGRRCGRPSPSMPEWASGCRRGSTRCRPCRRST